MATSSAQAREKHAQVLIVEDDGLIAHDIKMMLQELGYGVSGIAASGSEAMALARREPVDLVLMDVHIKGSIDGIETAAKLIKRHRLPIIYLTAHTDDETLARARETEPFGYVAKPITIDDIKVAVAVALTRYRSQLQVEEREEWLRSVLQSTAEAMIITIPQGRVAFLNHAAEEITGSDSEDACGQALEDIVQVLDENGKPQPLLSVDERERPGEPQIVAGTILRRDGTRRQVVVSIAPLKQNSESGCVVVLHDISEFWEREQELRKANEQLTQSNEMLTQLSHSLSHDLREPLRTITIYSDLLAMQADEGLSGETKEQLQGINQASRRMGTVMSDLMEYFSASNLDRTEARKIDANGPFRKALENLSAAIETSEAHIEAPDLPMVYAHPTALMLIFQNLIGNAVKYAADNPPEIRISADCEGDYWRFTVQDNGSGFDSRDAQRIFELFTRAHGREKSGNGIGLATCRRLVEQQSGKIWAESEIGKGARFYFTLPAESPDH